MIARNDVTERGNVRNLVGRADHRRSALVAAFPDGQTCTDRSRGLAPCHPDDMTDLEGLSTGVTLPRVDEGLRRQWIAVAHEVLRSATPSGRVIGEAHEPRAGRNYYSVLVDLGSGQRQRLLLNASARLVACAVDANSPQGGPLKFCAVPGAEAFAAAGDRKSVV